jgi:hypothetical protein
MLDSCEDVGRPEDAIKAGKSVDQQRNAYQRVKKDPIPWS